VRRRWVWIGVSVLGAIGVVGALWTIPSLEESPLVVRLDDVVPVKRAPPPNALRFAIAPIFSAEGTAEGFEPITQLLARELRRPVRMVQRRSYSEINDLLLSGSVQVALVCAGAWLRARHDGKDLRILVVPYYGETPSYRAYTIVRADGPFESMADLAGRRFAFTDPLSLSGHYQPQEWALENGRAPREFFRAGTFTYSHIRSIEAVLNGDVDAAAVSSRVWETEVRRRPDLEERLRIVYESPPLGANPVVVPGSVGDGLAGALRDAFVRLSRTEEGSGALARVGIRRFDVPPPDLYTAEQERFAALMRHLEVEP